MTGFIRCAQVVFILFVFNAIALGAQEPAPADTGRAARDSLTRAPISLAPVTITTAQPMRLDPAQAVRVTPEVIRRTPALNAWDLLRQAAGIEVHDQGQGPGFAPTASVRGFSSDHSTDIALWIDGVPVNEPVNGHAEGYADFSLLMPQAIAGIEVFKGPTSALFGNFATAGVVNVRTLERQRALELSLSGGSYGRLEGSALGGLNAEGSHAVLAVRGVREDGWRPHAGWQLGQAHARWVGQLAALTTLDAGVELYAAGWDSPGFLSDSLFQARRYDVVADPTDGGFKRRAQERVSLRVLRGSSLWRTTAYATQGRWQLFLTIPPEGGAGEGSGSQTEEEDHRYGFGLTSAMTWALPRGEITAGVESRWDHTDFERWFTTARTRDSSETLLSAHQLSGAAFVQSSADFTPHVRGTAGARLDAMGGKQVISPKLGLLVHLAGGTALYGNASRGFRQPDGVIADPSLPFITLWAYEAGAKLEREHFHAGAALFRMDVSNEQTFNPITLQSTAGGESRREGVELEAEVRLGAHATVDAHWTFNDARYRHFITADGDTLDGARVFNTSRHVGQAGMTLSGGRWHARVATTVSGPYTPFDLPGVELPTCALIHLNAGGRLPHVQVDLGIRNLLNRAYPELRAGGFVTPGQPRTLVLSVTSLR